MIKCEVCGKNKRLNASCENCAAQEKERLKRLKWESDREYAAMQKCCYCNKPAGKLYIRERYIEGSSSAGDDGMSENCGCYIRRPELTDDSVMIIPRSRDNKKYTVAHRKCHRDHLLAEAEELKKRALKMDVR
jgi:hypothetical protein